MGKSKKIGLVLPSVPGYSETFFKNKINGLMANGFEVVLFVTSGSTTKYYETAPVVFLSQFPKNKLKAFVKSVVVLLSLLIFRFSRVKKFYKAEKSNEKSFLQIVKSVLVNHVFFNAELEWLHFGFGTMALGRENVASAIGAKMAVSFRGFDHYVYPIKNPDCYKVLFSKNVKYHVLSEGMKKSLLDKGIASSNIVKITPAIDVSLFNANEIFCQKEATIEITTIARLHWIKGLEYTLEALALLKQKGISFHYTVVGEGSEKERLQFATHQLGLAEYVTFTGKLTPNDVKLVLEKTDLYLQYSIQEGFCNAVLEAQAMGKICIVSDAEGLTENISNNVTGFVVPKRKPVSLADKIEAVVRLSDSEKTMIKNQAIIRIENEFSIEKQIDAFISFYKK